MKRKAEYRKMPPGERQAMLAARPGDGDGRRARSSKRPGSRRCRQGVGRGRDPRPRHPHRRPSGEDHVRAGTPVCRRHRRTRACREQRPEAKPADGRQPAQDHRRGDGRGLRRLRRRRPRRAPHDIVFEVAPRRDQGMPEVQGPVPRQHPVQYGIQALVINLLVAQMLSLRRRARAGDIKLSEASAMLSRCVMGGGRRGAPPATPDVDDFGSTASGSMSSGRASSRTASKRSARATRASWASYMAV